MDARNTMRFAAFHNAIILGQKAEFLVQCNAEKTRWLEQNLLLQ
jgi:hypothetical protein